LTGLYETEFREQVRSQSGDWVRGEVRGLERAALIDAEFNKQIQTEA